MTFAAMTASDVDTPTSTASVLTRPVAITEIFNGVITMKDIMLSKDVLSITYQGQLMRRSGPPQTNLSFYVEQNPT